MATQVLGSVNGGWSNYSGHNLTYHMGKVTYDSVERSGNTVTVKGLKAYGPLTYTVDYGGDFGWASTWYHYEIICDYGSQHSAGSNVRAESGNMYTTSNPSWWSGSGGTLWGNSSSVAISKDISFTVGNTDTSKTFSIFVGKTSASGYNAKYVDPGEPYSTFTISFPKRQISIKATAENATFDIKKAGTSVGNDVDSYSANWDYNTAYAISDIKAKDGYYLTETTSDTSGNLTANKEWVIAKAKKYITFKVTGTNVTFDVKLAGTTVADDKESYSNTTVKQGIAYVVSDIKKKGANYILDSTNAKSGTTGSSNITINAGVASPISFASSITYKSPIKVTSKCDITIDDKSGRTRNWNFVAKLMKGNTVLATKTVTTGTTKTATVTFDRETTSNRLLTDTDYYVAWTISDKTDSFNQSFSSSTAKFQLPCLGYIVNSTAKKKISYFTITTSIDEGGTTKYSFKRVTKT